MSNLFRCEQYFGALYITGPQILYLLLDLQPERIADPIVTPINVDHLYGNPTDEAVRAAVIAGCAEANAEHGTNRWPLEIRYSYSSYDPDCHLMRWAALAIVEQFAEKGPDSFPLREPRGNA
jgi:hypothetical protein